MEKRATSPNEVIPKGELLTLTVDQIAPSRNNPRHLFDPEDLSVLKRNIRAHGVLVPITVYQPKGQTKYSILDGERRFRCCRELLEEGFPVSLPANVVTPPNKIAGLLYMFSIHNFREQWELMPTALGLKTIIESLGERENAALSKLTGLSDPQIERCKTLLEFEPEYQNLSLDPDPKTRIPSNFWIELKPVLDLALEESPRLNAQLGRTGILNNLVEKYRSKKIKSVLHFRRIMEAYENCDDRASVISALERYLTEVPLETRSVFDPFILDDRRLRTAIEACDRLVNDLDRAKLSYTSESKEDLRAALQKVSAFVKELLSKLEGSDQPEPNP